MDLEQVKPTAYNVVAAAGGAVVAGIARKKVEFLDKKIGQFLLLALGIAITISQKSQIMKGFGTGVAINSVLGLCDGFLAKQGVNGLGETYTDSDGYTYISGDEPEMIQMEDGSYMMVEEGDGTEGIGDADDLLS